MDTRLHMAMTSSTSANTVKVHFFVFKVVLVAMTRNNVRTLESKQLGPELKAFVDDPPSKGTIYIAFGSIVNWAAAPSEVGGKCQHFEMSMS